jgi:hypothetical protein
MLAHHPNASTSDVYIIMKHLRLECDILHVTWLKRWRFNLAAQVEWFWKNDGVLPKSLNSWCSEAPRVGRQQAGHVTAGDDEILHDILCCSNVSSQRALGNRGEGRFLITAQNCSPLVLQYMLPGKHSALKGYSLNFINSGFLYKLNWLTYWAKFPKIYC